MLFNVLNKIIDINFSNHIVNVRKQDFFWNKGWNYDSPKSGVWIVFNKLWRIFNPNFFNQGTSVSQGSDFKGDEIIFVRPVRILHEKYNKLEANNHQPIWTVSNIYYSLFPSHIRTLQLIFYLFSFILEPPSFRLWNMVRSSKFLCLNSVSLNSKWPTEAYPLHQQSLEQRVSG